jgi:hypothetical protein
MIWPRRSPQASAEAGRQFRSGRDSRPGRCSTPTEFGRCRSQNYISDTPRAAFEKRAPPPIPNIRPFWSKWRRHGRDWPIRRRSWGLTITHQVLSRTGAIESIGHRQRRAICGPARPRCRPSAASTAHLTRRQARRRSDLRPDAADGCRDALTAAANDHHNPIIV